MKTFSFRLICKLGGILALPLMMSSCNLGFGTKTIRVIGSTSMTFTGTPNCTLTSDEDTLSISWTPARGANGNVSYSLYEDLQMTKLISNVGKNTNYNWDVSSVEATRFSVYIAATDNDGTAVVSCYAAPTGGKHMPSSTLAGDDVAPADSGIWVSPAAQDKILVEWDPDKVPEDVTLISVYLRDDAVYNDQHKNTTKRAPLCTTHWDKHYCLVTGLLPNSQYRFLVRGTNTSNFEDHNTNEGIYLDAHGNTVTGGTYTLDHEVTNFAGILDLRKVGGVAGLSSLDIYVIPAQSGSLGAAVTGYIVSVNQDDDDAPGPFTFAAQTESGWSTSSNFGVMYQPAYVGSPPVPVTKFRIDGLALGTKYCVNVRAFVESVYTDADHNSKDQNRITLCNTTNGLSAPSQFAGLKALRAKAVTGSATVDYFTGSWDAPSTDGVYSEFKVYWQEAPVGETDADHQHPTCVAQDWSANKPGVPDSTTYPPVVVNESTFSAQMIGHGITANKKYYARVYSHYLYTGGGGQPVDVYSADSQVLCVWTEPPPPAFLGLLSVRPAPDAGGNATGNTTLTWQFTGPSDPNGSWTEYVFDVSTDPTFYSTDPTVIKTRLANGQTLFKNCLVGTEPGNGNCPSNLITIGSLTQTTTTGTLSGLTPDTKYYILAFSRYTGAGVPYLVSGPATTTAVKEVQTTPPKPLGEAITGIFVIDPSTVKITWQAPTSGQYPDINGSPATGTPLYNNYIVFHNCDDGDPATPSPATQISTAMDTWLAGGTPDPAITASPIATSVTSYQDSGEPSNQQCCYAVRAYYSGSGYVLKSATISGGQITGPFPAGTPPQTGIVCATPSLIAANWAGISSATPASGPNGFYAVSLGFPQIAANDQSNFTVFQADYVRASTCTGTVENCFNWNKTNTVGAFNSNWQATQMTLNAQSGSQAFVPNDEYIFAVRAIHHASGLGGIDQNTAAVSGTYGNNYVYSPRGGNFAYKRIYMHPPAPPSSNDPAASGGFSLSANGPTGLAVSLNMPSGSGAGGVYNTLITIVGKNAAAVSGVMNVLRPASLVGTGGKANQIDLFATLPTNYALVGPLSTSHTWDLTDGGGNLFGDGAYPYDAVVAYEDASQQNGSTALTLFNGFASNSQFVYVVQMLAYIDSSHDKKYSLLPDVIPDPKTVHLVLGAPSLQGGLNIVQANDQNDFTSVYIQGATVLNNTVSGGFTTRCEFQIRADNDGGPNGTYEVSQTVPTIMDLAGNTNPQWDCVGDFSVPFKVINLKPNTKYWLRERAVTIADNQWSAYTSTALPPGSLLSTNEATRDVGVLSNQPFWTQPVRPTGDGVVLTPAPSITAGPNGYYQATITYSPPTNASAAGANFVWVFKAVASDASGSNNQTAVKQKLAAAVRAGKSVAGVLNPALVAILPYSSSPGAVTWTDPYVISGLVHGYYMLAVYDSDTSTDLATTSPTSVYSISTNYDSITATDFPGTITPPLFLQQPFTRGALSGLANSTTLVSTDLQSHGTSDGTTFVKLCFNAASFAPSASNVDAWLVYYSPSATTFDYTRPWQTIVYGDPARDDTSSSRCIIAGGMGNTPGGKAYFVARAYKKSANPPPAGSSPPYPFTGIDTSSQNDVNTTVVSIVIPNTQANYAFLPKSYTKLGYDMWLSTTEAVVNQAGSLPTVNVVDDNGADAGQKIYKCNKSLHENLNTLDSSNCVTSGGLGTETVKSAINVSNPIVGVTWNQAWGLCRQSSVTSNPSTTTTTTPAVTAVSAPGQMIMRLPTSEEWRRAARIPVDTYGSGVVEANLANCNVSGGAQGTGSIAKTGSLSSCLAGAQGGTGTNVYGQVFDMGGNVAEWVDDRMVPDDIYGSSPSRARFGFPNSTTQYVWGRTVHNGIDNISRNYLMTFTSGTQRLALALGPDFTAPGAYQKQYDNEAEQWRDSTATSSSVGFRCAAFFPTSQSVPYPTMTQMQMPVEPQYQASEVTGTASSWKIPPNRYPLQNRLEKVRITPGTGASSFGALANGSITINWTVFQKYDCTAGTSCAPANLSGASYTLYRWEEPNYVDLRGSTPWALTPSGSAYSQVLALDPLAIKNDGTLVSASPPSGLLKIFGSKTCTNAGESNAWGCGITNDSSDSTFSSSHLYRYLLVVTGPNGDISFPRRQRLRSPYVAGTPANVLTGSPTSPAFRTEPGFRLAGVFPVDASYQDTFTGQFGTGNADPQSMVYVPMDRSGLDRDFFEYRNEGSISSSSPSGLSFTPAGTAGASFPPINSGNWDSHAGQIFEQMMRNACAGSAISCDNGNAGSVQSKLHVPAGYYSGSNSAPTTRADWYSACLHTQMLAGDNTSGPRYRLHLTTQSEWYAASNWGNLDPTSSTITDPEAPLYNASSPLTIPDVEGDGTGNKAGYCNTPIYHQIALSNNYAATDAASLYTGGPASPMSGTDALQMQCVSRFGALDMVGNLREYTDVVYANGSGTATLLDNGVDGAGLNLSVAYPSTTTAISRMDFWRGVVWASGMSTSIYAHNDVLLDYAQEPTPSAGGPYPLQMGGDAFADDATKFGYGRNLMRISTTADNPPDTLGGRPAFATRQISMGRCAYGW